MKNKEEDILKRFLQDTFSDYEPEPSDSTWENIRKEIQPHQPNVGAIIRQWIIPVVALLLLIGGVMLNVEDKKNNAELAINSTKENINSDTQAIDYQKINKENSLNKSIANTTNISEKINVNKAASKVDSKVLPKVEKPIEVPTSSINLNKPIVKQNVQEYSVSTKEFVESNDKSTVPNLGSSVNEHVVVSVLTDNHTQTVVSQDTDNNVGENGVAQTDNNVVNLGKRSTKHNSQSIVHIKESNENNVENVINHTPINNAVIEEVRYIKPLEILKNKDFVLVKNDISLPELKSLLINKDPKPLRRPTYMSVNFTPIQTYRIFTVNHLGVQKLQTNNLFDSERNGWAFELGIIKPIGNKWNFRGGISYLKMRQWAEYQVNTNNISVKNSNNYSNATVVTGNGTEYIGQTRIEQKTLQMVGLKGDIQKFFKVSGRNRYFLSGGSQLMYEPTEKQTNVFINASAGFQHVVNKDLFLTIEPTASYLLNNINDSKSLIQTNAYNLGLKVGVNFKVK
jgi:hypothetical protein